MQICGEEKALSVFFPEEILIKNKDYRKTLWKRITYRIEESYFEMQPLKRGWKAELCNDADFIGNRSCFYITIHA